MARRYIKLLAINSAVVAVLFGLLRLDWPQGSAPSVHGTTVTKPIAESLARKLVTDADAATPLYAVGAGRIDREDWLVIVHGNSKGEQCASVTGFFSDGWGFGCRALRSDAPSEQLGEHGVNGHRLVFGATQPAIRTVDFISDDGRHWSTKTIRAGDIRERFFVAELENFVGSYDTMARDVDGRVLPTPARADNSPLLTLCPSSESALRGTASSLPRAGTTTFAHVISLLDRATESLIGKFGATDVRVDDRHGQVWRQTKSGRLVVDAADAFLRVYLPSASLCPTTPQTYGGVPLSFAIGAAETLGDVGKAAVPKSDGHS